MLRLIVRGLCLALVPAVLACGTATAAPKDKKDKDRPGKTGDPDKENDLKGRARWVWTLSNEQGKVVDRDTFRGYRSGEVFHAKKRIGTWRSGGPTVILVTFTDGKLKGSTTLQQTKAVPPTYQGDLVRSGGKKFKLLDELLED